MSGTPEDPEAAAQRSWREAWRVYAHPRIVAMLCLGFSAGLPFLLIGVLGAFTTFSTFSIETLNLLESGQLGRALANVLISVIVCISAAGFGVLAARQL